MACNERCPFCNVPAEEYPRPTPPAQQTQHELTTFVASGAKTLTISGGEPTLLRKRLLALVREARGRGVPFVELQTNAVLIDAGYARELAEAGLTSAFVSLLSHRAELHDELAGLEGAFPDCLRGIDALLDVGIRVALNPVIAHCTQTLVADYVDFVAQRLPRVTSISLSAVQPHGRAAHRLDLLPDYAVLATSVRAAQDRAMRCGLELLNPYCGLPLCVGWADNQERSVEAMEALEKREDRRAAGRGHAPETPGIDNRGNKRHGPPCADCALRTRCGGAWHAYWDYRGGSGLTPPVLRVPPWNGAANEQPGQTVIADHAAVNPELLRAIAKATTPTVWVRVDSLAMGDCATLSEAGCTDLLLRLTTEQLLEVSPLTRELRAFRKVAQSASPQAQLRIAVWLSPCASQNRRFETNFRAVEMARALGVDTVRIRVGKAPGRAEHWGRFVELAAAKFPELSISADARVDE